MFWRVGLLVVVLIATGPLLHPLALVVVLPGGIYWLVRWHARNTAYLCPHCGNRFAVSTYTDLMSPNMFTTKLLRCPGCGRSDWCEGIGIRPRPGPEAAQLTNARTAEGPAAIGTGTAGPTRSTYFQIGAVHLTYLALWVLTLCLYRGLPERIPTHFDLSLNPDHWGSRSQVLILPLIAIPFPLLHAALLCFGAKQGYRSWIYPFLTAVFVVTILVFLGGQVLTYVAAR